MLFRSYADRAAHFTPPPKNSTGRSAIFFGRFSVLCRPRGTFYPPPKKQHRTFANFFGVLYRSYANRTAHFNPKNSTGRTPIFILALFRSYADRAAHITPPKSTGCSPCFCWALFRSYADRSLFGPRWVVLLLLALGWLKGPVEFLQMWRQIASCCLNRTCVLSNGTRCNNSGCCR